MSVPAATSKEEWTALRNELIKQSHEVFDDVRKLMAIWNRYLEHPLEDPEEAKNKVTTSIREILMPETWRLRLKVLELPVELSTVSIPSNPSGSRPTRPPGTVISGSGSASASVGPSGSSGPVLGPAGPRPPIPSPSLLDINPGGFNLNGGIRVEAPFLSKLLGILW